MDVNFEFTERGNVTMFQVFRKNVLVFSADINFPGLRNYPLLRIEIEPPTEQTYYGLRFFMTDKESFVPFRKNMIPDEVEDVKTFLELILIKSPNTERALSNQNTCLVSV